ncbi:MAG: hypothetical protein AAFU53_17585 [Cyanobacteria bacterium J06632_3]
MKNTARTTATSRNISRIASLERHYPNLCKVLYFPGKEPEQSPHAPTGQIDWYFRSPTLPRVGDVIPYGEYLFSVTTVILEDCCSADTIARVDRLAGRLAEKDSHKYQAVVWVEFWGVRSLG